MTLHRKFRKLLRDPKQFFEDLHLKRFRNVPTLMPKKIEGCSRYTVVSAVYNVGRYLDEYFQSLVDQRLDFRTNITLVMVDDGSTDDSAEIIKRWQKRYPKNVIYLHKENGGQASARNLGLEHVQTDWVTFIDPDDFVDLNYFLEVDKFLQKNIKSNLKLISCNFIFFHEDKGQFSDSHPLKYRFKKGDVILPYDDLNKLIQLSVNSAFFRMDVISSNSLCFDSKIRPNFEDGHFVGIYLSKLWDGFFGICSRAKYFYRKRSDGTSTLDSSWEHPGIYSSVLEYGFIDLFKAYKNKIQRVPKHIQRTVLYSLIWHLKYLINKPERCRLKNGGEVSRYLQLLDQVFEYIDPDTILEFELAGCWFYHKVGMLSAFKQQSLTFQIVYVEDFDPVKSQVLLRYFTPVVGFEVFEINDNDIIPAFAKTVRHDFLDRTFVLERRIWIPITSDAGTSKLRVQVGQAKTRLSMSSKQYIEGLDLQLIRKNFAVKQLEYDRIKADPQKAMWLLMDRDTHADDNAEHFYRYMQTRHSNQRIAFVLRSDSHDWLRLKQEGFNLLAFGSSEHEAALRDCEMIISSHADAYVVNYFGDHSLSKKPFVFLQHGVTINDLSAWLNSKTRIDCFVTAARPEYDSIVNDLNRYKFTKKEVVLTGLPRHDTLLSEYGSPERMILIMPTWRKYLLGEVIKGNERALNPDFTSSEYAYAWQSFLNNPKLHALAQQYSYKVIFFPHANIQPYLTDLDIPSFIEVYGHQGMSMQTLFRRAAILVTDFSSVALEMSLLQKPVIYYQFDEAAFFQGDHIHQKGYFDYRSDGFGPVVNQEASLIDELSELLQRDCKPAPEYLSRMEAFFPFRDGRNCERVYQAIFQLKEPLETGLVDLNRLHSYANTASEAAEWELAKIRWTRYLDCRAEDAIDSEYLHAQLQLAIALRESGLPHEAGRWLDKVRAVLPEFPLLAKKVALETARRHMMLEEWTQALPILHEVKDDPEIRWDRLICLSQAGQVEALTFESIANDDGLEFSKEAQVLLALAERDWVRIVDIWCVSPEYFCSNQTVNALLIRAFRELGRLDDGQNQLEEFQGRHGKNRLWQIESGRYAAINSKWSEVITFLNAGYAEGVVAMALSDALLYLKSLRFTGANDKATVAHEVLLERYPFNVDLAVERGENAIASRSWSVAAEVWRNLIHIHQNALYKLAVCLRNLGDIDKAFSVLYSENSSKERSSAEWILIAELAELKSNYVVAERAWRMLLSAYPDFSPTFAIDRLNFSRLMLSISTHPRLMEMMGK